MLQIAHAFVRTPVRMSRIRWSSNLEVVASESDRLTGDRPAHHESAGSPDARQIDSQDTARRSTHKGTGTTAGTAGGMAMATMTLTPTVATRTAKTLVNQGNAACPAPAASRRQQAAASSELRLTRRGRLVVSIASVVVAAIAGAGVITVATSTDAVASSTSVVYSVQPGDTLWGIAGRIRPGADRRETVAAILQMNPQAAGGVVVGESLRLPR